MKSILLIGHFPVTKQPGIRHVCEELADNLESAGWSVLRTPQRSSRIGRVLQILTTIVLRRKAYEVAHIDVFSGPAFRLSEMACTVLSLLQKRILISWHGGDLPGFAATNPARVRRLIEKTHLQTAPSDYLLKNIPGDQPLAKVIPNGLHIGHYPFNCRTSVSGRLIWLRAFKGIYNPMLAIEVLAGLRKSDHQFSLTMAGPCLDRQLMKRLRDRVAQLNIADHVDIRGPISKRDISGFLQQGDIFINTSTVDNTPVSVLEAMASGLCVISSNVGGIPYLLTHGHDALLADNGNVESFAAQIKLLLSDPALVAKLSLNARHKAERLDWSIILPMWETLLNEVEESKVLNHN